MSAEVPTPTPVKQPARAWLFASTRGQMLVFALLTLILTVATVWSGRIWLRNSETTFAVGNANGPEARFATKLDAVLKNTSSRLRLKILPNTDAAKAPARFDRKEAQLAMLRTDATAPFPATGWTPSSSDTNSCAMRSACGAKA